MLSTFDMLIKMMSKSRIGFIVGFIFFVTFSALSVYSTFMDKRTQIAEATIIGTSCDYSTTKQKIVCTKQISYQVNGKEYNTSIITGPFTSTTIQIKYDPKNPHNAKYVGIL